MSRKSDAALKAALSALVFADGGDGFPETQSFSLLAALKTNIRESLDELEMLRGTVQYWESRRTPTDPQESRLLAEAFRLMHGELLGLTARVKELLSQAELAAAA
jgi:hypothetical protein